MTPHRPARRAPQQTAARYFGAAACLALLGCAPSTPPLSAAQRAALKAELQAPTAAQPSPALERVGPARAGFGGATVTPVRLELQPGWWLTGALFSPAGAEGSPPEVGVLVAHGHFGQGKSGAEAQEIAWRLAAQGATVLSLDSPGEEEGALPGRQLHLEGGAHGRALLRAGGSSALAVQVTALQRGLDALQALGARRIGATGASGGAVLSLYLALVDPRVQAVVLASPPPIPREARGGGCLCDQLPGHPGPEPGLLASLDVPSLWLLDHRGPPPEGLPRSARVVGSDGPHSYTEEMQAEAQGFFAAALGLDRPKGALAGGERPPAWDLAGPPLPADSPGLEALPFAPPPAWAPGPADPAAWGSPVVEAHCEGSGPVVILAGLEGEDRAQLSAALRAAGLRACALRVSEDEGAEAEAQLQGRVWAERQAAALAVAAAQQGAAAIYAQRAWGLPAGLVGLPWAWERPICALKDVQPAADPAWVHTPGAWWGGAAEARCAAQPRRGEDRAALIAELRGALLP